MGVHSPTEYLLSVPLYERTMFAGAQVWQVLDVIYFTGTYDSYCVRCARESTFRAVTPNRPPVHIKPQPSPIAIASRPSPDLVLGQGLWIVHGHCTRMAGHGQIFVFYTENTGEKNAKGNPIQSFEKVGQIPSYGDLHLAETRRYSKALTPGQLRELTRAIGLASHDVGIGSYVYLRRVFEGLVEEAHQQAIKEEASWDDAAYLSARMGERIKLLESRLPAFLVSNPAMYSLLSKGIHELSETECLQHFDTLRIAIELILDERIEAKEKANKIASAAAALNAAHASVNSPKD